MSTDFGAAMEQHIEASGMRDTVQSAEKELEHEQQLWDEIELRKQLEALEERGFCWSVGCSRIWKKEARVYPRCPSFLGPVVIVGGETFMEAIRNALERIGQQWPHK